MLSLSSNQNYFTKLFYFTSFHKPCSIMILCQKFELVIWDNFLCPISDMFTKILVQFLFDNVKNLSALFFLFFCNFMKSISYFPYLLFNQLSLQFIFSINFLLRPQCFWERYDRWDLKAFFSHTGGVKYL